MKVKLKEEWIGRAKGTVVSVSGDRAYVLMKSGIAFEDKSFIGMYERANPVSKPKTKKGKKK